MIVIDTRKTAPRRSNRRSESDHWTITAAVWATYLWPFAIMDIGFYLFVTTIRGADYSTATTSHMDVALSGLWSGVLWSTPVFVVIISFLIMINISTRPDR